ncbi:MAG: DUF4339 domain-containing protein [Candidatus Hydrogenedentota bacterium]
MGWYFRRGNQAFGPIGEEELRMLIRRGTIDKRTLLQAEGSSEWAPAETLLPNVFDTPPPSDGASTPVKYEEVFPGDYEGAESVDFSSGGFGELDAFVDEMTEDVDMSFSSNAEGTNQKDAPAGHTSRAPKRPAPVRPKPAKPVKEEDSKAVCFGCGRLLKKVDLYPYEGALICSECRKRLEKRAEIPPQPEPQGGLIETHLAEWTTETALTILALALLIGFLKKDASWMLAAAPLAPAVTVLVMCVCGGLDYAFGRRMLAVTVFLWLAALLLYLPSNVMPLVVLLAGRGLYIWALGFHDIKKKGVFVASGILLLVSLLAGVLVIGKPPTSSLILILILVAADIAAAAMAWGAWQGGAALSVAGFATLLYVWDAAAVHFILRPDGLATPAFLTIGMVVLSALAVLSVDKETGRPKEARRWPLRRETLPLTKTDGVIVSLAVIAIGVFATLVFLWKGPAERLFFAHGLLLAVLVLMGTSGRLPHPNHVKWLLLAWALAILAVRIIPLGKGALYDYTLINMSKTYPVFHVGQIVQVLGGVALAYFACFHIERMLVESVRQWQKALMVFLAAFGVFALREVVELPLALAYPRLVAQGAYAAVFDLLFVGAGLVLGVATILFQERE